VSAFFYYHTESPTHYLMVLTYIKWSCDCTTTYESCFCLVEIFGENQEDLSLQFLREVCCALCLRIVEPIYF